MSNEKVVLESGNSTTGRRCTVEGNRVTYTSWRDGHGSTVSYLVREEDLARAWLFLDEGQEMSFVVMRVHDYGCASYDSTQTDHERPTLLSLSSSTPELIYCPLIALQAIFEERRLAHLFAPNTMLIEIISMLQKR